VSTLMAMPSARGLFHKAIVQSGPFLRAIPQARAQAAAAAAMDFLGIGADKLREIPAADLLRAYAASNEGSGSRAPIRSRRRRRNPAPRSVRAGCACR
jgi:para-nitrobenzyl esterase